MNSDQTQLLAGAVMDHCIALDFWLASHGGVCGIANTACCVWINETGKAEQAKHCPKETVTWLFYG